MQLRLFELCDVTSEFNLQLRNPRWKQRYAQVELYAVQRDIKGFHVFRVIRDISDDGEEIRYFTEVHTIANDNIEKKGIKLSFSDIFVYDLSKGLLTDQSESYSTLEEAIGFITEQGQYPLKMGR